jgi:hypothetical protein
VGPQPTRAALALGEHGHRRVIDVQALGRLNRDAGSVGGNAGLWLTVRSLAIRNTTPMISGVVR